MVFISTVNVRFAASGGCVHFADYGISGLPSDAIAILANVYSYNDAASRDHVVHSFGRYYSHDCTTWSGQVYADNAYDNDVMVTQNGDAAASFWYGHGHGSQIIGIKSNYNFDTVLNLGYSAGNHYVTLQVYGYLHGLNTMLPAAGVGNIRFSDATSTHTILNNAPTIPSGFAASAIFATITIFWTPSAGGDHFMVTFGRNVSHSTNIYNNLMWNTPAYYNDFQLTNSGDNCGPDYYGRSHGSHIIPLKSNQAFDIYNNIYKNDNTNAVQLVIQYYGFIPLVSR